MGDKTYKNFFDDGYTTYHDDGSKTRTYKNLFDDGYTHYHDDGHESKTYKHLIDDGYTTYHDDGGQSNTYKDMFGGHRTTTYHPDGEISETYRDVSGNYSTFNYGYGNNISNGYYVPPPYGGVSTSSNLPPYSEALSEFWPVLIASVVSILINIKHFTFIEIFPLLFFAGSSFIAYFISKSSKSDIGYTCIEISIRLISFHIFAGIIATESVGGAMLCVLGVGILNFCSIMMQRFENCLNERDESCTVLVLIISSFAYLMGVITIVTQETPTKYVYYIGIVLGVIGIIAILLSSKTKKLQRK